jgi:FkbM family methyltransferase
MDSTCSPYGRPLLPASGERTIRRRPAGRRSRPLWYHPDVRALAWSLWEHTPERVRRLVRPALAAVRRRRRVHTPAVAPPGLPADAVELDTAIGTLWFDAADRHVTPWVRSQGVWEADVMKLLARVLRPGGVVVDVGANVGFHTVLAAQRVGPTGTVYAVEPTPWTLALLRANLARHGSAAVVHEVAASEAPGVVRLAVDASHRSGAQLAEEGRAGEGLAGEGVEVRAATLDELVPAGAVDVLKVDVEGAEPLVLRGARELLERSPRLLAVVEFRDAPHGSGETAAEVLAFYESLGFELCLLRRNGELDPRNAADVLAHARGLESLNLVLRRR